MQTFNPQLLADPIILIAAFIAIGAIGIIAWAALNWKKLSISQSENDELASYEDDANAPPQQPSRNMESAGVFEAQLQEITLQLTNIGTRLETMEKTPAPASAGTDSDKTMILNMPPDIELKLRNIEAKLEGIHKLLIILTDSGDSK
jgi:hypothetical protein